MRLVAITDRRRMVPADVLERGSWPAIAAAFGAAVQRLVDRAGAGLLVQVREKDLDGGPLLALVRVALATGARVAVNERVDVALAAGAHAVHLPERGLSVADARSLAPDLAIGISCHTVDAVRAAAQAGADLAQLGPIWATPDKGPPLGAASLGAARRALASSPTHLVAVGGIDSPALAAAALAAGADATAAIRAAWSGALPG
ncbi:MAG: thiamine phosphate synthase [Deltaproteobacteria bacterium]|nr:thiamine phosphate synthase [Deltaproteobacteria bacterium]